MIEQTNCLLEELINHTFIGDWITHTTQGICFASVGWHWLWGLGETFSLKLHSLSWRMGPNQFCSICFEGEIASSSCRVHHISVGHKDLSLFTLCYETKRQQFACFKQAEQCLIIWLFLDMQRVNQKHPQKAFHLTSCCDNWHWWYPLTMSRLCISCIHSLIYILKVEFHFSSVLQPLWPFPPCFARCCDKDGVWWRQLSTPWFHGLWDLLTLSVEWTPNEILRLPSTASTQFGCLHKMHD